MLMLKLKLVFMTAFCSTTTPHPLAAMPPSPFI